MWEVCSLLLSSVHTFVWGGWDDLTRAQLLAENAHLSPPCYLQLGGLWSAPLGRCPYFSPYCTGGRPLESCDPTAQPP